jgi:hypothetical protein
MAGEGAFVCPQVGGGNRRFYLKVDLQKFQNIEFV